MNNIEQIFGDRLDSKRVYAEARIRFGNDHSEVVLLYMVISQLLERIEILEKQFSCDKIKPDVNFMGESI